MKKGFSLLRYVVVSSCLLLVAFGIGQDSLDSSNDEINTPAEEIGLAYIDSLTNWDAEAMHVLLADDVVDETTSPDKAGNLEELKDEMAWLKALNWNFTVKECEETSDSEDIYKVSCVSEASNDISRGLENPNESVTWNLEIQDDKIIGIYPVWDMAFVEANLVPLKAYTLGNISDYKKMYQDGSRNLVRGEENLELLQSYVTEFLASQQ